MMRNTSWCLCLLSAGLTCVPLLHAQSAKPDSIALRIERIRRLEALGFPIDIATFLGQDRVPRSAIELSRVSDSLLAIANSRGIVPIETRRNLVIQVGSAGTNRHAVPFAGAGDFLLRVIDDRDPDLAITAVTSARGLADKQQAVRILKYVAESKDMNAGIAVMLLFSDKQINDEGKVVLRQLWSGGLVTQKEALEALTAYAGKEGWPSARD